MSARWRNADRPLRNPENAPETRRAAAALFRPRRPEYLVIQPIPYRPADNPKPPRAS
jgi:hypothetical protein